MRNILIAASLIAGMGFAATGAAHADAFNGRAQRSIESSQNAVSPEPGFGPSYTPSSNAQGWNTPLLTPSTGNAGAPQSQGSGW